MKRWILLCTISFFGFVISGCINIEPALSGKAYEEYVKSIRPYIEYWEKYGVTREDRARDNLTCRAGGVTAGGIYKPEFDKARLPGEKEHETYSRLFDDWQRCMLKKGYRFTGPCYDNEVGRTSPACIGRQLQPLR